MDKNDTHTAEIFAGVLAGGAGRRMAQASGCDMPKQFIELDGVPVIIRSIRPFLIPEIKRVYVAVVGDWLDYAKELVEKYFGGSERERIEIIEGGADRTGSLMCVIEAIRRYTGNDAADDILLSHDAARPFVTDTIIRNNIAAMEQYPCVGTAVPVTDTILCSMDGRSITDTPPRSTLYQAQTPQTFRIGFFADALGSLSEEERAAVTDVCGVVTRAGGTVGIAEGSRENIKLTTPADLIFGEAILRGRK